MQTRESDIKSLSHSLAADSSVACTLTAVRVGTVDGLFDFLFSSAPLRYYFLLSLFLFLEPFHKVSFFRFPFFFYMSMTLPSFCIRLVPRVSLQFLVFLGPYYCDSVCWNDHLFRSVAACI
jgi:hypothetical protein